MKRKLVHYADIDPDRIIVIPNGIEFERINDISKNIQEEPSDSGFRLLYVGRLLKSKNVDHLIRAYASILSRGYEVSLDIVGMGDQFHDLMELSKQLGVGDRVKFHGFLQEKNQVYEMMSKADLFVSPSVVEGFGITHLESMGTGTPIIGYNLGAYQDFIKDGYNGYLVEPNNQRQLEEKIVYSIENPDQLVTLTRNGLKVAKRFDIKYVAEKLRNAYLHEIQA